MMPARIQLRRTKGWRKPAGVIVVARPSRWGNPFRVGPDGDADTVVARYRLALCEALSRVRRGWRGDGPMERRFDRMAEDLHELRGRDLACWCPPGSPCHADVLIELANRKDGTE